MNIISTYFQTDRRISMTGWNMTYDIDSCGGYLTGPTDIITSPNYPEHYPNDVYCSWLINYQQGSQIEVKNTKITQK